MERVGIVSVGRAVPSSSGTFPPSAKELVFEAASRAYAAAGIDPRTGIDSFLCASEDLMEGTSIAGAYAPDQLGAVLRPLHTVGADGVAALGAAVMQIRAGVAHVVVVEAHALSSDVRTLTDIEAFALDPVHERPLGLHPWFVAGLEMQHFLAGTPGGLDACIAVAERNHGLAQTPMPSAAPVFDPLRELDCAAPADAAYVVVVAAEDQARRLARMPVWVDGIAWWTGGSSLATRSWGGAPYARAAARRAYEQAGVTEPENQIDVVEADDTFTYKLLQHCDALDIPFGPSVTPAGGILGRGDLYEANGLAQVAAVVDQLRGEAAGHQREGARTGLAQTWRGIPTLTGSVAVLSVDRAAG